MTDGCLVVYKPSGLTSHDVIDLVRKRYRLRAGHAGTLDPLAQGVLLVFLEKSLKILQYLPAESLDKTYLMRMTLGVTTDTYDSTGTVVHESPDGLTVDRERILGLLPEFVGWIDQKPPAFSAIKVGGKRAYDLARSGKPPDLAARKIRVFSIRLVRDYVSNGRRQLVLRLHCSRGTYVRSIAHELGARLGCGAHLSYLLRERVGLWSYQNAFPAWKMEQKRDFCADSAFVPIQEILPFSKLVLVPGCEGKVKSGSPIEAHDIASINPTMCAGDPPQTFQICSASGQLLGLYGVSPKPGKTAQTLTPLRVLL
jgi:tRNA pseudouridine55 synthase